MMKKPVLATAILVTALTASSVFAWGGDDNKKNESGHCGMHSSMMNGKGNHHGMKGMRGMKIKEQMNRSYTADQIKTLSEAHLIRKGNPNVHVGDVTPSSAGYKIRIVTKDNSLVEEYEVAKNGMQLDRYNAMKKKMEYWEEKRNS